MEQYIDWNSRMLRPETESSETVRALCEMRERFGIRRFCMMQDFHANTESVTAFLIRTDRALRELKAQLPKNLHVRNAACVHLYPGLAEEHALHRLTITSERLLPLQMPLTEYDDWIDLELNQLLYKRKITPLFLSFELCAILYPKEIVEKLLRIPYAAYQFNYKALQNPEICRMIFSLLSKSTVLLGTSLNRPEKIEFYEFSHYIDCGNRLLHKRFFEILPKRNLTCWREW